MDNLSKDRILAKCISTAFSLAIDDALKEFVDDERKRGLIWDSIVKKLYENMKLLDQHKKNENNYIRIRKKKNISN